jgi:hypothetical protein
MSDIFFTDKTKNNRRLSGGRLSIHVELPSTVDTTLDTEITVHNPDSNEDVLLSKSQPFRLPLYNILTMKKLAVLSV